MNVASMLQETAQNYSENAAILYKGNEISYRQLNRFVNALAIHLKGLGIQKGDKVAIMLPNCPEFIISYFASIRIGAVAVTVNVMSTSYELLHVIEDSDAYVLITTESLSKRFREIQGQLPRLRHLIVTSGLDAGCPFADVIENGPDTMAAADFSGSDPAVMIYSSGLTGKSLGAVLTFDNLKTQAVLLQKVFQGTQNDRCLAVIPLFHSFGASVNMLSPIYVGAGIVLMESSTMEGVFSSIQNEKVTYLAAVPRLFMGMLFYSRRAEYDISSLRFGITGGSAMPPEYFPELEKHLGIRVLEGYGLTETSPCCVFTMPSIKQKPGSIGTCLSGVEAKVVDEAGREVQAGVTGELVIRGDVVMQGYHKDPEATARVMRGGWLHSGDLAYMDEEGYVFLVGLKKRMIITSGFNVYPGDVEQVLNMHPGLAATKVIGRTDLMRGEIVKALIVTKPGLDVDEKEIIRHCRVYLSSYKVPREIEFVASLG